MDLRNRIGVDLGQRCKIEDGLAAAVEHGIRYLDVKIDVAPNAIETLTPERIKGIRDTCEQNGIHIGVHTMSAVNVAEVAPHVRDGVERYLQGHMDACKKLGGEWMVVHAGYHFTSDVKMRMEAGLERLKRLSGHAETIDLTLLLENMNWEPDDAEVHYLAHNVEESALLFRPARLAEAALGLHGQPRAYRRGRRRRLSRCARRQALRRGAPRRLLAQRQGGAPPARPGRFRLPGSVPQARRARFRRPLHGRLRHPAGHDRRAREAGQDGLSRLSCKRPGFIVRRR